MYISYIQNFVHASSVHKTFNVNKLSLLIIIWKGAVLARPQDWF